MTKKKTLSFIGVVRQLFKKYQQDRGNVIVSSISFYVLLTFIPFTLFSIFILGYVIDVSNPAAQLETSCGDTQQAVRLLAEAYEHLRKRDHLYTDRRRSASLAPPPASVPPD